LIAFAKIIYHQSYKLFFFKLDIVMNIKELTVGIEEEYQVIDPKTGELTSYIAEFLERDAMLIKDSMVPEFLKSQLEVTSKVCKNIKEARSEVIRLRQLASNYAKENNCKIIAAGTHPYSHWKDQVLTDKERYHGLYDSMQYVAKRLLIFGMHVHIGIPDKDLRIDVMNQMRYFIPHILSLSSSSPFWQGQDTGFKSYRGIVFEDLPRTGPPETFDSFKAYKEFVNQLITTKSIDNPSKIWWDMRPHHKFPTLEFRMCDSTTKVDEVMAIAALIQALVATMIRNRERNISWRDYRQSLISENKWRAMRHGIDGKMIDLGAVKETDTKILFHELIEIVKESAKELGTEKEIEYIYTMLENGTSADRQLKMYTETQDLKKVVDMLAKETLEHC
jgi:carboxylate-amine ligase